MKKNLFLLPLAAAMMLTACSDDELANGGGNGVATGAGKFLAVSIVSNGSAASRADDPDGTGDDYTSDNETSQFEDGLDAECKVKTLRLYFFSAAGDAVPIKKGSDYNYYDILPAPSTNDEPNWSDPNPPTGENHDLTVESILKSVVMVDPGERLPALVLAVVNANFYDKNDISTQYGLQDKRSYSLSEFWNDFDDYSTLAAANKFVMTNSVYFSADGMVTATPVSPDCYAATPELAKTNPVEIYVERSVAKVRMSVNDELKFGTVADGKYKGDVLYKLYKKGENGAADTDLTILDSRTRVETDTETDTETGTKETNTDVDHEVNISAYKNIPVYLKLEGWDVTADVKFVNFLKHVNETWDRYYLGSDATWNRPAYHRSYWADECNPQDDPNSNKYFTYGDKNRFVKKLYDGTGKKESVYCNENAERYGNSGLVSTKVIIKGTLCDENGYPLTISEYGGNRYIDKDDLSGLKNRYLTMMQGVRAEIPWRQVKETNTDGSTTITWVPMDGKDLTFVPTETINSQSNSNSNSNSGDVTIEAAEESKPKVSDDRYYVYPCLTKDAEGYDWYINVRPSKDGPGGYTGDWISSQAVNNSLIELSHAKVWKTGMTYYFAEIQHLGNVKKKGVVRNHIYDLNITKIYGIGTPVYDPGLTIIPETPADDNTYIAARVNILSWRLVTSNITLDWD